MLFLSRSPQWILTLGGQYVGYTETLVPMRPPLRTTHQSPENVLSYTAQAAGPNFSQSSLDQSWAGANRVRSVTERDRWNGGEVIQL